MTTHTDKKAQSFADYFESTMKKMDRLQPGQALETTIVSIAKDTVFLQLSGKSEGVLDRAELADADGNLSVKEGDTIKVFFLEAKNGEMRFTTRIAGEKAGSAMVESAYKNRIPVEGLVEKEIKGGYQIRIGETRAFCPYSQMGTRRAEDSSAAVGTHLTFMIIEYKEGGRNITVSNRAILEAAQEEKKETLKAQLSEGMVLKASIVSIQDFGAFVDIGGVQALLPVSEISRTRVQDIRAVLSVGQEVEVQILKLDWKNDRLSVSMKSLQDDPWAAVARDFPAGSVHNGKVSRIADFGAFVTLAPGIDGLVHGSELRGDAKYNNVSDAVKVGQTMSVEVLGVDSANRRISLKPASSVEEREATKKYTDTGASGETYNPFAALLQKKK